MRGHEHEQSRTVVRLNPHFLSPIFLYKLEERSKVTDVVEALTKILQACRLATRTDPKLNKDWAVSRRNQVLLLWGAKPLHGRYYASC